MLAVARGPLRRSVDAARPFACGVSAVLATLAVATPSALAADAPARVFEQVTPVHKYTSDVYAAQTASADGNAIAFNTYGSMDGGGAALFSSTYVARRGDDGWHTQGFTPIPPVASPNLDERLDRARAERGPQTPSTLYAGGVRRAGRAGRPEQRRRRSSPCTPAGPGTW